MPIVTTAVAVGTVLATTIAGISDADKRKKFEFAISRLSSDRQDDLNKEMARAKNQTERLSILANAVAMIKAEERRSEIQGSQTAERNKIILIVGGGLALLITAFLIKKI
jgi:hypothetical protein